MVGGRTARRHRGHSRGERYRQGTCRQASSRSLGSPGTFGGGQLQFDAGDSPRKRAVRNRGGRRDRRQGSARQVRGRGRWNALPRRGRRYGAVAAGQASAIASGTRDRPGGGHEPSPVDVRLVAATHQDLRGLVAEREFREDLYYRLKGVEIRLPPLRERRQDMPHLVRHFVEDFCRREQIEMPRISPDTLASSCRTISRVMFESCKI